MKKLLLLLSVYCVQVHAQVINPSFETWSNDLAVPSAMNPNAGNATWGWWDYNFFNSSFVGSSPVSVLRSDTAHAGLYSARIESKIYTPTSFGIYQNWGIPFIGHPYLDTLGILFNGNLNETVPVFKPGTACTQKIGQFNFWYQYKPNGVDTAECRVLLLNQSNPVAGGMFKTTLTTGSTWQLATINLTYVSALTPDTLYVLFSSCSLDRHPKPGSVFWIDDISISLLSDIQSNTANNMLMLYPNPAGNSFAVRLPEKIVDGVLQLIDAMGNELLHRTIAGDEVIATNGLPAGVYHVRVTHARGFLSRKLVVQ